LIYIKNMEENMKIRGEYYAFSLPADVTEDSPVIEELRRQVREGKVSAPHSYSKNIIPTSGRSALARLLVGDTTYTGEINDVAIGDGASPSFTNASTQLVNEVYRKVASSQSRDGHIAYIDVFYAQADCADQDYHEAGTFIDGDNVGPNTGQAWSLTALDFTKNGSLYLSCRFTIN
jgi:hypothetical protein